ncbi:MAG: hypothetical protein ABI328_00570, partial [Gemmatimonadaceae bacterium]
MIHFDAAHEAVHYPPDRRFRIWIRPSLLIGIGAIIFVVVAAAWIQMAMFGVPILSGVPLVDSAAPHGFPLWVRYCHFFNFL